MTESRLIKRYQNRKLYDTKDSSYVTLEAIGQIVGNGEAVTVIDNSSKKDITADTLLQVIFQRERAKDNHNVSQLMGLLRTPTAVTEAKEA